MEKNYKLEKEYTIPFEVFKKAYDAFQKKNVYPKSYIFMGLFLIIAIIYIFAAIESPKNTLAYVLILISLGLAFREWYNPKKIRRNLLDAVQALGEEKYRLCIDDEWIEISTITEDSVENSDDETKNSDEESDNEEDQETDMPEDYPESSRIPINSEITVQEYDQFFLLHIKKRMFYIIPKEGFTEYELEIIRELNLKTV